MRGYWDFYKQQTVKKRSMSKVRKVELDHGKCLARVRREIMKANPELKAVYFNLANVSTSHNRYKYTGQSITYITEYKKRDGSIGKREGKSFVAHDYCPYCGKKID